MVKTISFVRENILTYHTLAGSDHVPLGLTSPHSQRFKPIPPRQNYNHRWRLCYTVLVLKTYTHTTVKVRREKIIRKELLHHSKWQAFVEALAVNNLWHCNMQVHVVQRAQRDRSVPAAAAARRESASVSFWSSTHEERLLHFSHWLNYKIYTEDT